MLFTPDPHNWRAFIFKMCTKESAYDIVQQDACQLLKTLIWLGTAVVALEKRLETPENNQFFGLAARH